MGSIKIIIIILCVVGFIIKTIAGDAKRERKAQHQPATPQPRVPEIPTSQQPTHWPEAQLPLSHYNVEGESNSRIPPITSVNSVAMPEPIDEEERQAELDRWRRALIDSEILKTKF